MDRVDLLCKRMALVRKLRLAVGHEPDGLRLGNDHRKEAAVDDPDQFALGVLSEQGIQDKG